MSALYLSYLESLCKRRGWHHPTYIASEGPDGFTCRVTVNGREYQTDVAHESPILARENAARSAFMICRNFSINGGMIARNGIIQGLPLGQTLSNTESTLGPRQLLESSTGTVGHLGTGPKSSASSEMASVPESHAFTSTLSEQDTTATSMVASSLPPHRRITSNRVLACARCQEVYKAILQPHSISLADSPRHLAHCRMLSIREWGGLSKMLHPRIPLHSL